MKLLIFIFILIPNISYAGEFERIIQAHHSCVSYVYKTNPNLPIKSFCYCLVDWQRTKNTFSNKQAFFICKNYAESSGNMSPMWIFNNIGVSTKELVTMNNLFIYTFWNSKKGKMVTDNNSILKSLSCIGKIIINSKIRMLRQLNKKHLKKCIKIIRYFPNHFKSKRLWT